MAAVLLVLWAMRGKWRDAHWSNPTVLAAIIAGSAALGVAIAGAISGSISAAYQSAAEQEKSRGELLEKALLAYQQVDSTNIKNLQYRMRF